jgi:hypothetical protein
VQVTTGADSENVPKSWVSFSNLISACAETEMMPQKSTMLMSKIFFIVRFFL